MIELGETLKKISEMAQKAQDVSKKVKEISDLFTDMPEDKSSIQVDKKKYRPDIPDISGKIEETKNNPDLSKSHNKELSRYNADIPDSPRKVVENSIKDNDNSELLGKNVEQSSKTPNIQEIEFSNFISKNLTEEERLEIITGKGELGKRTKFPIQGTWDGEKGNSNFYPNLDDVPKTKTYGNEEGLNWRQLKGNLGLKESDPIPYKNGQPDFAAMNLEFGKVVLTGENGIGEYLKASNNFDKEKLDVYANKLLAKQEGLNYGDKINNKIISVYRGSSFYVKDLADMWKCSPEEVWIKCKNPTHRKLVWHEYVDGKTMALVPWDIHEALSHVGGMKMYKEAYKKSIGLK